MLELLRTNDLVLISRVEAILAERGIGVFVADQHMSALEGSLGFLPRRMLIDEDDVAAARAALAEAGLAEELHDPPGPARQPQPVRQDAFLGGKIMLRQPVRGHRAGTDAALLAAAAPADFAGLALDAGAGVGAAGISLAATRARARVGLIEIDAASAALARENLELNGLAARGELFEVDLLSPASRRAGGLRDGGADLVLSNPPFLDPARSRASPDADRRRAHVTAQVGAEGVASWIAACLALTRPGGVCILIHRPDRLDALLGALTGRAGEIVVLPVHPHAGEAAVRILVRARRGSRGPLSIAPGFILHDEHGFTPQAQSACRGERCLFWGGAP